MYKNNRNKVTVALKEATNQAPLTLPTSVGSAEIKNYRKEKKQAVSPALERGMGCGILDTQLWHQPKLSLSGMLLDYKSKSLICLPRTFSHREGPQALSSMRFHTPTRCDRRGTNTPEACRLTPDGSRSQANLRDLANVQVNIDKINNIFIYVL